MPRRSTLRLTKRIVERLKAEGKDAIFWDRALTGFGVRVHTTGRKLYIVQSRGPAGLKRVTLGPVDGETIDRRRREAAIVIDRIKRGEDPIPLNRRRSPPSPTWPSAASRITWRCGAGPRRRRTTGRPSGTTSFPHWERRP